MGRKRAPEHDYICRRCGCACNGPDESPQKHLGGGSRNMRACGKPPVPVLRSVHEAEMDQFAADVTAALRRPRYVPPSEG